MKITRINMLGAMFSSLFLLSAYSQTSTSLAIGQDYVVNQNVIFTSRFGEQAVIWNKIIYNFSTTGVSIWYVTNNSGYIYRANADGSFYASVYPRPYGDLPGVACLGPGMRMPVLINAPYKIVGTSVMVDWSQGHSKYFQISGCNSGPEVFTVKNSGLILESATTPGFVLTLSMAKP